MRVTKTEPHSAVTFYAMLAVKLARSLLVPGLLPPSHLLLISRSEEEGDRYRGGGHKAP